MRKIRLQQDKKVINAVCIGSLCSAAYLAAYFARNILGAVTPQMIEAGYSAEYIGRASSLYFITYAVGQLINGAVGEHVKARYMICAGLLLAGVFNPGAFYSSCGPEIYNFYVEDGKAVVECSPAVRIRFHSDMHPTGMRVSEEASLTRAEFPVDGWAYVRAVVIDKDGKYAWSNPIFM